MIKQSWIKKLISYSQWNNWYSKNSSYCKLKEDASGVWIGFLVADEMPYGCLEMTDYELIQVDNYRRANFIAPYPLKDIKVDNVKVKQSTLKALDKLKIHIKGLSNKMGVKQLKDNPIQKPEKPISEPYKINERVDRDKIDVNKIPF